MKTSLIYKIKKLYLQTNKKYKKSLIDTNKISKFNSTFFIKKKKNY